MIKLPLNQVGTASKISHASSKFEQEFERRPSLNEIADTLDLPEEKIEEAIKASGHAVSVDAPLSDSEGNSLIDVIPNDSIPDTDEEMLMESLREEISRALNFLDDRERVVIESYFGIGQPELTLEEIAQKCGLTRERVRQIREKAIRKLRNNTKNKLLKSYLGK